MFHTNAKRCSRNPQLCLWAIWPSEARNLKVAAAACDSFKQSVKYGGWPVKMDASI